MGPYYRQNTSYYLNITMCCGEDNWYNIKNYIGDYCDVFGVIPNLYGI